MVARIDPKDGTEFWGCSTFPSCQGTRPMTPVEDNLPPPKPFASRSMRPDAQATRRNGYYRLFGVALMVAAGAMLAVASVRDRVRGNARPPAI
jgi:ssDNA-binding Zn-finger/Zn-ribbon topoisomerase 1